MHRRLIIQNQAELEMLKNFILKIRLDIRFRSKLITWTLLAIGMIVASYAIIGGLARGALIFIQPLQKESTLSKSKNDKGYEEQILRAVEGAKAIKQVLKDPNSFQLDMINIMPSGAVCYAYLSRNEVGEMNQNIAVLIKNEIKIDEMQGFDQQWQEECHGKQGEDVTGFGKLMIY